MEVPIHTAARRIRAIINEYDKSEDKQRSINVDGFDIQKDYAPYVVFNLVRLLIHTDIWREFECDEQAE